MSIKLERLMEALGLCTELTEEDKAEIKERREKHNESLYSVTDDIRARKILSRIKDLVNKVENIPSTYVNVPYQLRSDNSGIIYTDGNYIAVENNKNDKQI